MSPLRRIWTLLPRSARREALFSLTALLAPRIARPAPPPAVPVVVAGYFNARTGLGAATRRLAAGLREQGIPVEEADLTGPLKQGPAGPPPAVRPGPGTLLVHVNGPMLPWALLALGRRAVAGKRVIGVWNWELPVLPADWNRGLAACHAVWVGSEFVAGACRRPDGPPVQVVPYPLPRPAPSGLRRADFGLPERAFVTLAVFDATSSLARKNPLGAIEAHARAFGGDPGHILVLKTHGTAEAGPGWAAVAEAAAARPNIRVMDASLSRGDLWALMAASDALISLHRSEGFGFAIAEMMELGRPVVATGWSGNTDFMHGPGCHAVGWRLVPARDPQGTYDMPGALWAEPDPEEAAAALRRIAEDPALRNPPPVRLAVPDYRAALGLGQGWAPDAAL
ncbi:glycosyltransferase family 4 protein [Pararoseomonas indoligenes]|uniref:Glycosyltransferase family 4 protein n=1 Tax=Roseomonas indoligenes TaxID=2820811 RepID=A0A940N5T2_9PROT|nr:glycosyltransferase family 4 protein [Pararoseomonas indoligenes]MBP0494677.1 glycosyltransferase family 4 protein [Pararoseomonas indoligenes]